MAGCEAGNVMMSGGAWQGEEGGEMGIQEVGQSKWSAPGLPSSVSNSGNAVLGLSIHAV